MTKNITLIELFSGIGGFAKGLIDAGYTIDNHYFSEIDKHAIANYKYNFKNSTHVGSVTDFQPTGIKQPHIITFGSPCQDLSLAGKRQGLNGKRSVLILEAIRIIQQTKPSVFVWENVKGAFSSNNSKDFWAIIQAFANIGGYRLEWQLLNTSWFLPQNRERLYLIGHLDGSSFPGVFPFTENDTIFNKPYAINNGQSQAENCTTITNKFGNRADDTFIEVPRIAGCLTGGGHSGGLHSDMTTLKVKNINHSKEFGSQPHQQNRVYDTNGIMACLSSSRTDDKAKIKVVAERGRKQNDKYVQQLESNNLDQTNTLTSVAKDNLIVETKNDATIISRGHGFCKPQETSISPTINSCSFKDNNHLKQDASIRRLTEIECERLQGFPDNWTKYGDYDGVIKPIPKTQRYKLLGNAVTVDVVKAIAQRLNINS